MQYRETREWKIKTHKEQLHVSKQRQKKDRE